MEYEKSKQIEADESGYSEKKTDLLIDRAVGKGLSSTKVNNIIYNKTLPKKKKIIKVYGR